MNKYLFIMFSIIILFNISGYCEQPNIPTEINANIETENKNYVYSEYIKIDSRIISASNKLGFDIFAEISKNNNNVFISPVGIFMELSLIYNEASSETQKCIAETLNTKDLSLDELNMNNLALLSTFHENNYYFGMKISNSIWKGKKSLLKANVIENAKKYYNADIKSGYFQDKKYIDEINYWMDIKTLHRTSKAVHEINTYSSLLILNASIFNSTWKKVFNSNDTKIEAFNLFDGSQKQLPMMHQSGYYLYYGNKELQVVELPYGGTTKNEVSMYIFLPAVNTNINEFNNNLNNKYIEKTIMRMDDIFGNIVIPKFKIRYRKNFNNTLKAIGMQNIFDKHNADFKNICYGENRIWIDEIKHETCLSMDEKGTKVMAFRYRDIPEKNNGEEIPENFTMTVNRPFFVVIMNNTTKAILFMGSIVNPEEIK